MFWSDQRSLHMQIVSNQESFLFSSGKVDSDSVCLITFCFTQVADHVLFFTHQMGAYHTIELELNRKFTLAKKSWDSVVLDRIGKQVLLLTSD